MNRITTLVADRRLPYMTQQDFVRDACVHRAQWIAENVDESWTPLANVILHNALLSERVAKYDAAEQIVEHFWDLATKVVGNERDELIEEMRGTVDLLPGIMANKLRTLIDRMTLGYGDK